ncbi:MAG TPA: hypothetical protein VG187_10445 [Mycobacterium sp.]|jgi:hypothetical protein|nr:hypothetical protein [Mycobacterium sp.]
MATAADELETIRQLKARYTGGIPEYRRRCDEIADGGYTGFKLV